ncbi:FAD/NAD-P-binding domain-containing protein [Mycena sanguinolenta]|nr:FAD/NAD-P-binding domain-containing protein [Mycena sanguinolenta]
MSDIVIIGAGVGGISFAINLKRQLGVDNFTIYDKGSDIGGTWRDNVYPGAASDTFVHMYSLSTDLNPNWSSTLGSQPEMWAYWQNLARKYDLYRHISFNHQVISAEWNSKEQLYHIVIRNVMGVEFTTTAKILISAVGVLETPRFPDIPGISLFEGDQFHSAQWNTELELRGKRVAVIGNGASAMQFVPVISEDPTVQVTEFCRTPNWLVPPMNIKYSSHSKWAFSYVPFVLFLHRFSLFLVLELLYLFVFHNAPLRFLMKMWIKNHISKTAPKEEVAKLIPDYKPGCKRLLNDTNYLTALHRPNLTLNWDGIQSIFERGILTKKGVKLEFDAMIFATGFVTDQFSIQIRGIGGMTIQQYYDSQGGPKAYLGVTVPGFPNLFMIAGPNTTTGHTSVILFEELQIDYILKFVKPILDGVVSTFEVSSEATDRYNDWIHDRLSRSVHMSCTSWYRVGGTGKISSIFPGSGTLFWWCTRKPRWSDYKVSGKSDWKDYVRRGQLVGVFSGASSLSMLAAAMIYFAKKSGLGFQDW